MNILKFGLPVLLLLIFLYVLLTYFLPSGNNTFYNVDQILEARSIFFIETSGASHLNTRQACAVESTSRHYPLFSITVLMTTQALITNTFNLSNVQFKKITFEELLAETPLSEWYRQKKWKKSEYKINHLSDAARYALIWKFGGIYFDLDIVMLKPLSLVTNFILKENENTLANGILGMKRHHSLLYNCMKTFAKIYNPNCFNCAGPHLITNELVKFCNGYSISDVERKGNCDITLMNSTTAFPLPYFQWKDYFLNSSTHDTLRKMKNSYMIHVWNQLSSKNTLYIGSGSAYEITMTKNCPLVYSEAVKIGEI
ncbi:lactosylceramide 4-alpha-galactosyltransferase-like [Centruroides vittatus]|uniref:lactosylceramide 4-alpha-galactosyltransferase-like n=1 Tax=Centruroides vittatus TaxID=120091 RepID=UPI00350F0D35